MCRASPPAASSTSVLQRLLGPEIALSGAHVSRATAKLDEGLKAWREHRLGETPCIVECAVLIAVGIEACGKRRVLGCEVATSEGEINWRRFLEVLLARGSKALRLVNRRL